MSYPINMIKFFFPLNDHLFRIQKAESFKNLWKVFFLLLLSTVVVYFWMASLGLGSDTVSVNATELAPLEYEASKLWFVLGRMGYGLLLAVLILLLPSLWFYVITGIPYKKLLIMQQAVLLVMLLERITWIPLAVYFGLEWFVSPLSFGIIASYFTELPWVTAFFGAISLFQLWIIWFQVKFLRYMSSTKRGWIWAGVISLHLLYWALAAALSFTDIYLISGWFE
ncbi:hypothetical protein ACFO3D_15705 [Virgibacillus kekensis]|uniref:Yip1 domain-containing protein n=1 Tax=Virgibacillus kekensis TaxID=202261 RepID=A0ABV9DL91_9BACI